MVSPVGSNREVRLEVRTVAATHRDLRASVAAGEFREDLFHRLRLIELPLKPLIERSDDEFDRLVHVCLAEAARVAGRSVLRLSKEAASRLESYSWPGNIRELRNVLEYAAWASDGPEIRIYDLPEWFLEDSAFRRPGTLAQSPVLGVAEVPLTLDFQTCLERFEKEYLERALGRFRGRVNLTARQIGMNKTTFIRRLKSHGIRIELAGSGA
jgi:DNA-binding NtrC family response regulator